MAFTVQEFLARGLEARFSQTSKFTACGGPGPVEEQYTISDKPICSDCYYDCIGEEIDRRPIYNPTIFRANKSR